MKFAAFAKMAVVAGVLMASVFGQALSAQASEEITMGYTKVEWQYVDSQTSFAADLTVNDDGTASGSIHIASAAGNLTLKRGLTRAETGSIRCEGTQPFMIVEGTYYEEIDGQWVAQGPMRVEIRQSGSSGGSGGGGGDIDLGFDFINNAVHTHVDAQGLIGFEGKPCR